MKTEKTKQMKRSNQYAVRTTISLPPQMDLILDQVVAKFGFGTRSDYIQARLRKDAGMDLA